MLNFAILGAGNAGHALAADLTLKGFFVKLYEFPEFKAHLDVIREQGGIEISGGASAGFAKLHVVTTDVKKAIEAVDCIMVAAPAFAHEAFTKLCAPHLVDEQIIIFVSNFGAIRAKRFLEKHGVKANVLLAEIQSLPYAARVTKPGHVRASAVKRNLSLATLPAKKGKVVLKKLRSAFPEMVLAKNTLETSLNNPNPVIHPAILLLNAGRIEATVEERWGFYKDGVTQSIGRVIEELDRERLGIMDKMGFKGVGVKEIFEGFYKNYKVGGENISDLFQTSALHGKIGAPSTVKARYITEDIPYALTPLYSFGEMWGLQTPAIYAIIQLSSIIMGTNYFEKGVTVEDLGFSGLSPAQIQAQL